MFVGRAKNRLTGRRVLTVSMMFGLLLILLNGGLHSNMLASSTPQTVYQKTGETTVSTQDVSSINFASNIHTNLSVQCWEQPQFRLTWTIEAANESSGRDYSTAALEEFASQHIKVTAAPENGQISVRVAANASAFKAEKVTRDAGNPGGVVLRDTVNGLSWKLTLTAFVPSNLKIDSQQFKGVTSVRCGEAPQHKRSQTGSPSPLRLNAAGTVVLDTARAFADEGAVSIKTEAAMAMLVKRVEPRYPPVAAEAKIRGSVTLKILVDDKGEVRKVQVTSGHPLLRDAATKAVSAWKFMPLTADGGVVPFTTTVTVAF